MLVLQSSTYKGGLDTLDDPECNLGSFLFCARLVKYGRHPGVRVKVGVGDAIRDLLDGGGEK